MPINPTKIEPHKLFDTRFPCQTSKIMGIQKGVVLRKTTALVNERDGRDKKNKANAIIPDKSRKICAGNLFVFKLKIPCRRILGRHNDKATRY